MLTAYRDGQGDKVFWPGTSIIHARLILHIVLDLSTENFLFDSTILRLSILVVYYKSATSEIRI